MIFIGIIGFIFSLSASFIAYGFNYYDNLINYFNDLREILDKNEKYMFYSEIFLIIPLFAFSKFMQNHLELLIIYHLNPIYGLVINNLSYGIIKLLSFIINGSDNVTHFVFAELAEVFAVLGYLVYLEIVELNFCEMSDNLRRKIILKSENEFIELSSEEKKRNIIDEDEQSANSQDSRSTNKKKR